MQINTTSMESSMEIPQKAKDRTVKWSSDTIPTQKNVRQDTVETRVHCTNVHCSTIYNSQVLETTQMP
jgi:hypothetical protein